MIENVKEFSPPNLPRFYKTPPMISRSAMVDGDLGLWVKETVRGYVNESPENTLKNETGEKAWADPLVGFSSGADPLYPFYKEDIGSFFMTPVEWLKAAYPEIEVDPGELRVHVIDTGWGIPAEEQEKVFDRFYRGKRTGSEKITGNGLGLALAKEIACLHGGDLELESQEGKGSKFTLHLPLK